MVKLTSSDDILNRLKEKVSMYRLLLLALCGGLLIAACGSTAPESRRDLLIGKWVVVSATRDGATASENVGDTFDFRTDDTVVQFRRSDSAIMVYTWSLANNDQDVIMTLRGNATPIHIVELSSTQFRWSDTSRGFLYEQTLRPVQ